MVKGQGLRLEWGRKSSSQYNKWVITENPMYNKLIFQCPKIFMTVSSKLTPNPAPWGSILQNTPGPGLACNVLDKTRGWTGKKEAQMWMDACW